MDLKARMSLENKGFLNPLEGAKSAMEGFRGVAEKITGVLATLGVSFAAFRSAEGITEGFKGVFELGKELQSQSRIIQQSVGDTVVLRQAWREAGLDAGGVTTAMVMLQNALGGVNDEGQPTKEIFRQLNLDMEGLKKMTGIQQIQAVSKAIAGLNDDAKTAALRQMFGRSGAELQAVFGNPAAIEEARKAVGAFGSTMQENAAIFARISNGFELLGDQSQRFIAGVASEVAPQLDSLLDKIKGIDLTGLGKQAGTAVAVLSQAVADAQIGELLRLSLLAGAEEAAPTLQAVLTDAITGSLKALTDGISDAVSNIKIGGPQSPYSQDDVRAARDAVIKAQQNQMHLLDLPAGLKSPADDAAAQAAVDQARSNYENMKLMVEGRDKNPATKSGQKTDDMPDVPKLQAMYNSIAAKFQKAIQPTVQINPDNGQGSTRINAVKGGLVAKRETDSDRLARIGLFVGGSGAAGGNDLRKLVDQGARNGNWLQQIAQSTINQNRTPSVHNGAWAY